MKKNLILFIIILSVLTLVNCDDAGTSVSPKTSPNLGEMSLSWLGDYASHPSACTESEEYDAYYNTTEGKSYFCDGIDWRMVAQNGTDGTDGTDGTNGTDGVDGKTIEVSDINENLLGYSISYDLLFSPNGYLYTLTTINGTIRYGTAVVRFETSDCTGDGFIGATTETALRGILAYDTVNDTFLKRRNTTVSSVTVNSFASNGNCIQASMTSDYYYYDVITRQDAGIPETITLPLVYEFK